MVRSNKIMGLLKLALAGENTGWKEVLEEVENPEINYSEYPEMKVLVDSTAVAADLKQKADEIAPIVKTITPEEIATLKEYARDPELMKQLVDANSGDKKEAKILNLLFIKSASKIMTPTNAALVFSEISNYKSISKIASNNPIATKINIIDNMLSDEDYLSKSALNSRGISKRAGIWDSISNIPGKLLGGAKSVFKGLFRLFPIFGALYSAYEAYHNFGNLTAASNTIKSRFSSIDQNTDKLFNAEYIKDLIAKSKDDPVRMLELAKLNKVARFYQDNFLHIWYNAAWFLGDLIGTIMIVATGGVFGAALGIVEIIASLAGITSAAGFVATDWLDIGERQFIANTGAIKGIATKHISKDEKVAPVHHLKDIPEKEDDEPEPEMIKLFS